MQTLLAENRVDDLTDFMLKNNFIAINDNVYYDWESTLLEKGDIFPIFSIMDVDPETITSLNCAKKALKINFTYDPISPFINARDFRKVYNKVTDVVRPLLGGMGVTNNSFTGGNVPYTILNAMKKFCEEQENFNCDQIDRYTLKTYNIEKDEESTFVATNFLNANSMITTQKNENNAFFYGPGEYGVTLLSYGYFEQNKSENGETLYTVELTLYSLNRETARDNINVDFFMALKNFNDRIWVDK